MGRYRSSMAQRRLRVFGLLVLFLVVSAGRDNDNEVVQLLEDSTEEAPRLSGIYTASRIDPDGNQVVLLDETEKAVELASSEDSEDVLDIFGESQGNATKAHAGNGTAQNATKGLGKGTRQKVKGNATDSKPSGNATKGHKKANVTKH